MGYYIEVPSLKGKAEQIRKILGGEVLEKRPKSFADVPQGKALICVVDNGQFEAAAFCYSEREFREFAASDNLQDSPIEIEKGEEFTTIRLGSLHQRPRQWVLVDWNVAVEQTGFPQ